MRAIWNEQVIADSAETIVVEGNHYFPPDTVDRRFVRESDKTTRCPWKGSASYYDIVVGDAVNKDAAWYYPETLERASHFRGHVAFWRGVTVEP